MDDNNGRTNIKIGKIQYTDIHFYHDHGLYSYGVYLYSCMGKEGRSLYAMLRTLVDVVNHLKK